MNCHPCVRNGPNGVGGAGRIRTADEGFADLAGLGIVLFRAGLWSVQLPRFAWCLGRIGLRLDYRAGEPRVLRLTATSARR
jgi:hypothetical protein